MDVADERPMHLSHFLPVALIATLVACGTDDHQDLADSGTTDVDGATAIDGGPDAAMAACITVTSPPAEIRFPWAGDNGIFDPSMTFDPGTGRLWMSYSSVDGQAPNAHITQQLAYSPDQGLTWCSQGVIAQATEVLPADRPASLAGASETHWSNEVSAIVFDRGATDPNKQWVVVWHRYLNADGVRNFGFGWIAMKTAATPEGLIDAPEQKLFSALGYYPDGREAYNNAIIGPPQVVLSQPGQPGLDGNGTELDGCIGFTEPGLVATDDALHVLLLCSDLPNDPKMVIVKLEHSNESWGYTGQLLTPADAASAGPYISFSGGELYEFNNEFFVVASPIESVTVPFPNDSYRGCTVFQVDLSTAETQAAPTHPNLPPAPDADVILSGVCTFDAAAAQSGFIFGEAHLANNSDPQFRLFLTGLSPL